MKGLRGHVSIILETGSSPLDEFGFQWKAQHRTGESCPFKYITQNYSPFLAYAVYTYIGRALEIKKDVIRLGPESSEYEQLPNSMDDFSTPGEKMIPYFLETVLHDDVINEYVELLLDGSILTVVINSDR